MAKRINQNQALIPWGWLPVAVYRFLVLFLIVVLLSVSVAAIPGHIGILMAQQPSATSRDAKRAAARQAFEQGLQLYHQLTTESLRQAIAKFEEARRLFDSIGDRASIATTLNYIGQVYNIFGQTQKALDYYNQALPLMRAVGDKGGEAIALYNIAQAYDNLGDAEKALDYYNQALPLYRAVDDANGEALTSYNIGAVYDDFGDKQNALQYLNQALRLFENVGDKGGEARTRNYIGGVYSTLSDNQKALEYLNQALQLNQRVGDIDGAAKTLINLGQVYSALGEKQKALNYFNQALPLNQALGDKKGVALTLINIGQLNDALGEKQKALDYYNQALSLTQAVGYQAGEAVTRYSIAFAERGRGNLNSALAQMEESLKIIESLRTKITSQELRTSYFATVQDYYKFYIDLLMQLHKQHSSQGYDAQALQASERTRARSLLELLAEAGADIRQGVDPKLLEQEQRLQQQLNAKEERRLQLSRGENTSEQVAALQQDINELLTQYQEIEKQIKAKSPRYAALTQPQPLTLQQIQSTLLDDNTLLLEYSLGKERSYLWAVTKTGIASYSLPKQAEIEKAANQFRGFLRSPSWILRPRQVAEAAAALSQMLLEPVAGRLGKKRLLVVSDGALQYIPFAALTVPGKSGHGEGYLPLVVEHEIINNPSASTLSVLRNEVKGRFPPAKTIAIIADPVFTIDDDRVKIPRQQTPKLKPTPAEIANAPEIPNDLKRAASDSGVRFNRLPGTRTEAVQILALVPPGEREQAFDFAANRAAALSTQLRQYKIVHFATHGILNSMHPELSGVILSLVDEKGMPQNGFLRLNDIYNLNLPAELVVLSACETGLGEIVKGEGLVGLTRGFMYAGAKRVVVSLWKVDDAATAELMTRFYRAMLKQGLKPAAALRAAQIEMWKQTQWKEPYYWAAFVMQGEWR